MLETLGRVKVTKFGLYFVIFQNRSPSQYSRYGLKGVHESLNKIPDFCNLFHSRDSNFIGRPPYQ